MKEIKIYLVDDHTIVRDGIKMMMLSQPQVRIIGDFGSSEELFKALKETQPDILLLDINLPGLSGIEITKIMSQLYPEIGVLVLSGLEDEETIVQAIRAGAKGFLPKKTDKKELLHGILEIYNGNRYFGTEISRTIFNLTVKNISMELDTEIPTELTTREIEIVKLFTEGLLYKEIADRLSISIKTVESHKANIMRKLELKSTAGLVKYAIKKKIITL
ncbi:MAG TPA: response regulator transcription factor [Fulvivirga sp.]|nr:response regulator transcription factor [Fulvivirga sp.]